MGNNKVTSTYRLLSGQHARYEGGKPGRGGELAIYTAGVEGQDILDLTPLEAKTLGRERVRRVEVDPDEDFETEVVSRKELSASAAEKGIRLPKSRAVKVNTPEEDTEGTDDTADLGSVGSDVDSSSGDWDFIHTMKVSEVVNAIRILETVEDIEALVREERRGKARPGVLKAAAAHRVSLG